VRARISVISEIPQEWRAAVSRWTEANERYKTKTCPDHNTEYFLYQTMLGAWPIGTDRLWPYMEKAVREAKSHSSWLAPQEPFETATRNFIEAIYADRDFIRDFEAFVDRVTLPGRINALSQTLLKLTAPGIPDTYQGTELWDLSLVDPDELRRRLLAELPSLCADRVWERMDEGLPKLWTIWHALRIRNERQEAFDAGGAYTPLAVSGSKQEHAVAFRRGEDVAVIVTRLPVKLANDWQDTTIDPGPGKWTNVLTGRTVKSGHLKEILDPFPVALLRKSRKTGAVSSAPPEELASSSLLGGARPRPLRF
jgi:(1->4)-alpha-D-glucan 1-alpha-D-glucosylmutase